MAKPEKNDKRSKDSWDLLEEIPISTVNFINPIKEYND